ncbi:hypothetical protein ACFC8N_47190 [Streptomyces sp. NPDC055966]|uniref:hypothetical protein n=1 Tax=unclassified Streptomyces TaxID=2593676 RepID=UPI0035E0D5AA
MARSRTTRLALAAASGVLALGGTLATAGPASASPGDSACAPSPQGSVCIWEDGGGYDASFSSNISGLVDFNLIIHGDTQHVGDGGAFTVSPGSNSTYYFATGTQSSAYVCLYSRDGQFSQVCTPILRG